LDVIVATFVLCPVFFGADLRMMPMEEATLEWWAFSNDEKAAVISLRRMFWRAPYNKKEESSSEKTTHGAKKKKEVSFVTKNHPRSTKEGSDVRPRA